MGGASEASGRGLDIVAYLSHAGEELAEILLSGARQVGYYAVLPGGHICAPERMPHIVSDSEPTCSWSRGAQARGAGEEGGRGWNKSLVVRSIWLRHIVVVFAIGVELHTTATGQAAAALDLPRLAGFASGPSLASSLVKMPRMPCKGSRRGLSVYAELREGPTMRCACISLVFGTAESHCPLRHGSEIASHWALSTI